MPNQATIEAFLREKIAAAVMPRTRFSVGSVEDETICLVKEQGKWNVGYGERGRFYPEALFDSDIGAAKYVILLLLERPGDFVYPAVDWTAYASLPD